MHSFIWNTFLRVCIGKTVDYIFVRPLADRSGRCAVGEALVHRDRGASMLPESLAFVDRLDLDLDRIFELRQNFRERLRLVNGILAFAFCRKIKVEIYLVNAVRDPELDTSAFSVFVVSSGIRAAVFDERDDVGAKIRWQVQERAFVHVIFSAHFSS